MIFTGLASSGTDSWVGTDMLYFTVHDTILFTLFHCSPRSSPVHLSPRSSFVYDGLWSRVHLSGPWTRGMIEPCVSLDEYGFCGMAEIDLFNVNIGRFIIKIKIMWFCWKPYYI